MSEDVKEKDILELNDLGYTLRDTVDNNGYYPLHTYEILNTVGIAMYSFNRYPNELRAWIAGYRKGYAKAEYTRLMKANNKLISE